MDDLGIAIDLLASMSRIHRGRKMFAAAPFGVAFSTVILLVLDLVLAVAIACVVVSCCGSHFLFSYYRNENW